MCSQAENQNVDSVEEKENIATEQQAETVVENNDEVTKVEDAETLLKINKLTEDLAAAKDEVLRAQAEVANMRRRCEQEVDKARKFALDRFVKDLLPALDPMEKAIQFADKENEATKVMVQGIEATYSLLLKSLKDNGVECHDPMGEPFNPEFHQAIQSLENNEVPANHVMAVIQKGYTLNGRVVRPAMVIVSKGNGTIISEEA